MCWLPPTRLNIGFTINYKTILCLTYVSFALPLFSPDSPHLMFKVEFLERQIEIETQEKQKAEEKSLTLEQKMEELEKQLKTVEQQVTVQSEEKHKAEEKCSALEVKVTELEKPSEQDNKACENCKVGETLFYFVVEFGSDFT